MELRARTWGDRGPPVVVLHGGPGAPGSARGLARALAPRFRVFEPDQRARGDAPLTVGTHVDDLRRFVATRVAGPPALVGWSWGAMLALAFAARCPDAVTAVALVGCGTFDEGARALFEARLRARLGSADAGCDEPDPDRALERRARATFGAFCVDPIVDTPELDRCDARGHAESWNDMVRRQVDGTYPAAFAAIRAPVAMFHGVDDPHPGRAIHRALAASIRGLAYFEWERCGHYPWLERAVRDDFVAQLGDWLAACASADRSGTP